MGKYVTRLRTEQIDDDVHQLIAKLVYQDEEEGTLTVPEGFVTDFASIRKLNNLITMPLYALLAGYGNYASTVHDYLYRNGKLTRARCDAVFYRALLAEGVAKWRAAIFYAGVRAFGASSYKD
jgi:hypothetical protein